MRRVLRRRGPDGVPRAVWLITILHLGLLFLYSVGFASFRGPDEPQHTDLIRYVRAEAAYPRYDGRNLGQAVFNALGQVRFDVPAVASRDLPADAAPPRDRRPSFDELGSDLLAVPDEANQLPSHPPLYYALTATVIAGLDAIVPGEFAFDEEVALLRLLGALLLAPLPLLTWATAHRLGARRETAVAAAAVPLVIPQLHHIGASVTNDNLLTLLIAIATLLVARVLTNDRTIGTALLLGLVTGLAVFTKAFALFLPVWIVMAYAVALRRGWNRNEAALSAAIALGVAFITGGWWWLRNIVLYGQLQTGIKLLDVAPAGFEPDVGWWAGRYLRYMPWRFWGWFGWFDVALPAILVSLATAALIAAVVWAFVRRPEGPERLDLAMMLVPLLAIAAMVAIGAFQGYLRTSFDEGLQGRYLFPGLVGLAVIVACGLPRRGRGLLVVLIAAGVMQLAAAVTILDFYWGGEDLIAEVRSLMAWAPWPPKALAVAGALVVVAGVLLTLEAVGSFRRGRQEIRPAT